VLLKEDTCFQIARCEQLEFAQNKWQNAWQQFQTTKGKAKNSSLFL
jgi:survival-of-motor-neuron-related-splicing factor 30